MSRSVIEQALLSGANMHSGSKHTDGTFPHNFWIGTNGNDGTGNGSQEAPYLTVRRAVRQAADGRGDRLLVMPGSYAETLDIGAGATTGGNTNGGYAKRDLQIIGDDTLYNGRVQIIGDGATAQATILVEAAYLRGFVLKNVELDTNGLAQPALDLVTSDTGATPAATANNYRFRIENVAVRSDDPRIGFQFRGATLGDVRHCRINGPGVGLGFIGSPNNNPADLMFEDIDFSDCVTADIMTLIAANNISTAGTVSMTNVQFFRMRHWDRGGTPVTNYINFVGTMVNVHTFDFYAARDVADDTLMALPVNMVAIGKSAASNEFIIGA